MVLTVSPRRHLPCRSKGPRVVNGVRRLDGSHVGGCWGRSSVGPGPRRRSPCSFRNTCPFRVSVTSPRLGRVLTIPRLFEDGLSSRVRILPHSIRCPLMTGSDFHYPRGALRVSHVVSEGLVPFEGPFPPYNRIFLPILTVSVSPSFPVRSIAPTVLVPTSASVLVHSTRVPYHSPRGGRLYVSPPRIQQTLSCPCSPKGSR